MLRDLQDFFTGILGINADTLSPLHMVLRAIITFIVTVAVIRLGNKRLFGKGTAFDNVVAIMIGSVMSTAITSSDPGMLGVWAAGLTLIGMHWMLSTLSYHLSWFGSAVKGHEVQLVRDGQVLEDGMQETGTTQRDLARALRSNGDIPDLETIRMAYLERDGSISIVPMSSEPKVVEVSVKDGVQTVRIALE